MSDWNRRNNKLDAMSLLLTLSSVLSDKNHVNRRAWEKPYLWSSSYKQSTRFLPVWLHTQAERTSSTRPAYPDRTRAKGNPSTKIPLGGGGWVRRREEKSGGRCKKMARKGRRNSNAPSCGIPLAESTDSTFWFACHFILFLTLFPVSCQT